MLVQKADLCWCSPKGNFLLNNRVNGITKPFIPLQTLTNFNRYEIAYKCFYHMYYCRDQSVKVVNDANGARINGDHQGLSRLYV